MCLKGMNMYMIQLGNNSFPSKNRRFNSLIMSRYVKEASFLDITTKRQCLPWWMTARLCIHPLLFEADIFWDDPRKHKTRHMHAPLLVLRSTLVRKRVCKHWYGCIPAFGMPHVILWVAKTEFLPFSNHLITVNFRPYTVILRHLRPSSYFAI